MFLHVQRWTDVVCWQWRGMMTHFSPADSFIKAKAMAPTLKAGFQPLSSLLIMKAKGGCWFTFLIWVRSLKSLSPWGSPTVEFRSPQPSNIIASHMKTVTGATLWTSLSCNPDLSAGTFLFLACLFLRVLAEKPSSAHSTVCMLLYQSRFRLLPGLDWDKRSALAFFAQAAHQNRLLYIKI